MESADQKPFTLLYEEIALRSGMRARGEESKLKRRVAEMTERLPANRYHEALLNAVPTHIITTNYDNLMERAFRAKGRSFHKVIYQTDESTFLVWRPDEDEPE